MTQRFKINKLLISLGIGVLSSLGGTQASQQGECDLVGRNEPKKARINVITQDPSVFTVGSKDFFEVLELSNILPGPSTKNFTLTPSERVKPSYSSGECLEYSFKYPSNAADAVSVFGTVVYAYDMYDKDMQFFKGHLPNNTTMQKAIVRWEQHNDYSQMIIHPHATDGENNAYYNRDGRNRELRFFPINYNGKKGHTAQSGDIVSHEAGHSILDVFRPDYFEEGSVETGGLHEGFGDLTALFVTASQKKLCDRVMRETGGDLHKKSFLPSMAEEFGAALGDKSGLRHLDKDVRIDQVEAEVHDISRVFSGAIYDTLAWAVKKYSEHDDLPGHYRENRGLLLQDTASYLRKLVVQSFLEDQTRGTSFLNIAQRLYNISGRVAYDSTPLSKLKWGDEFYYEFERRGILGEEAINSMKHLKTDKFHVKQSICGTACKLKH